MQWNLRMVAAQRGIWRASDLRRALGEGGLQLSAGKMSYLWSGRPISVRLDDLDVICAVLECAPNELLLPEQPVARAEREVTPSASVGHAIRPSRSRRGRSVPPA